MPTCFIAALVGACAPRTGPIQSVTNDELPHMENLEQTIAVSVGVEGQLTTPRTAIVAKPGPVDLTPEEQAVADEDRRNGGWNPLEFYQPQGDRTNRVDRHSRGASYGIHGGSLDAGIHGSGPPIHGKTRGGLVVARWPWAAGVASSSRSTSFIPIQGVSGKGGVSVGYDSGKWISYRDRPRFKP